MDSQGLRPGARDIDTVVRQALDRTTVIDVHTHLFPPGVAGRALSGIDDLLTYH